MVRAVVLSGLFLALLWLAAMDERVQGVLMLAGIFAVCAVVDRWGRGLR
jgi:hypothetical protein